MDIIDIKDLESQYGTPFYLLDIEKYVENINKFSREFTRRYDNLVLGYSFKTNYLPPLCIEAMKNGAFAEVVSRFEYDLALKLGYDGNRIIFNGPIKKEDDIFLALNKGSIINLDSHQEVRHVIAYKQSYPLKNVQIGLRINIDLKDESGFSHVQCGLREGRFGFSQHELDKVVELLNKNDIKIFSIHGHTSSSDRAVDNYEIICNQLLKICELYNLIDLKYFNIGGGFFGAAAEGIDISNKPTYADYAERVTSILLTNKWFLNVLPYIVIEPGVSVVANTLSFISKIYEVKEINDKRFIVIDGSVYDVKPTMHQNNLSHTFITSNNKESLLLDADVVGSTCMEKDVILKNIKSDCNVGDYILFEGIGAYTLVMTPTFINPYSPVFIRKNGKYKLVRKRQTLDDFMSSYII